MKRGYCSYTRTFHSAFQGFLWLISNLKDLMPQLLFLSKNKKTNSIAKVGFLAEREGLLVPADHAAQPLANLPTVDFKPEGSHPFLFKSDLAKNQKANLIAKVGFFAESEGFEPSIPF
jgi:hypothetical protein